MLKQELNRSEIEILINYLKHNLFRNGKTMFFEFFTDLKQIDNLPWVSATFKKEKIEIQFNIKN
jgi:hypothetical protein